MKSKGMLFLFAIGMFVSCVAFWLSGYKDLANQIVIAPVIMAVGSMFMEEKK